jgi:hypothetical protein
MPFKWPNAGPRSLFESGQDSTGAMPHRQAGFYLVIFLSTEKVGGGGHGPLFHGPCNALLLIGYFINNYFIKTVFFIT